MQKQANDYFVEDSKCERVRSECANTKKARGEKLGASPASFRVSLHFSHLHAVDWRRKSKKDTGKTWTYVVSTANGRLPRARQPATLHKYQPTRSQQAGTRMLAKKRGEWGVPLHVVYFASISIILHASQPLSN